jgi:hypothetical protein
MTSGDTAAAAVLEENEFSQAGVRLVSKRTKHTPMCGQSRGRSLAKIYAARKLFSHYGQILDALRPKINLAMLAPVPFLALHCLYDF